MKMMILPRVYHVADCLLSRTDIQHRDKINKHIKLPD